MIRAAVLALVLSSLASVARAQHRATPAATCGGFERLALEPAVPLLEDRARIQPLHGMRDDTQASSIMAADPSHADETRLVVEAHGERFVVLAYDPHATTPADLAGAARDKLAGDLGVPESTLTPVALTTPGATVVAFAPTRVPVGGEVVPVLLAVVVPADGHPVVVTFFVTSHAFAPGCTELARRLAATLAGGPRALDVAARDVVLSGLVRVHVPAEWTCSSERGPDFEVHRFERLAPLGSPRTSSVGAYVGGHPQTPPTPTRTVVGRLLGQSVRWGVTTENGTLDAQALVRVRDGLSVHVWATGRDDASMDAARAFAETFALAPRQ